MGMFLDGDFDDCIGEDNFDGDTMASYYGAEDHDWPDFDDFFDGQGILAEHYEEVVEYQYRWQWTARHGKPTDLRRVPLQYAMNLVKWMEEHDTDNTPYMETGQYEYLREKLAKNKAWIDLATKVLQGPKYSWQTLKTYSLTSVSSVSSKETPAPESRSRRRRSRSPTSSTTTGE